MQNYLATLRKARGLSQVTFAAIFGVCETTVVRWERGYTHIPHNTLLRLAHYFDVTPSDIVPDYGNIPTATDIDRLQHALLDNTKEEVIGHA